MQIAKNVIKFNCSRKLVVMGILVIIFRYKQQTERRKSKLSCSPDPISNSETTSTNFPNFFSFSVFRFLFLLSFRQKYSKWFNKKLVKKLFRYKIIQIFLLKLIFNPKFRIPCHQKPLEIQEWVSKLWERCYSSNHSLEIDSKRVGPNYVPG